MECLNKQLKEIIFQDLYRCTGKRDINTYVNFYWREPTFRFTVLLRKFQFYSLKKNKIRAFVCRIKLKRLRYKYGFFIPNSLNFGRGLYIGHIGTIIINVNTTLGDNINISQGVTIGQANRGSKKGCPKIGNEVWIGTNAVIVGNVTIGNNVLIAPNAYVNTDVPDNSIVIGNPAQIHHNLKATDGYICNKV